MTAICVRAACHVSSRVESGPHLQSLIDGALHVAVVGVPELRRDPKILARAELLVHGLLEALADILLVAVRCRAVDVPVPSGAC